MRKLLVSTIAAALSMPFSCISSGGRKAVDFHWFEYIPQELLDKFAKDNDIEVTMDTYESNEALIQISSISD